MTPADLTTAYLNARVTAAPPITIDDIIACLAFAETVEDINDTSAAYVHAYAAGTVTTPMHAVVDVPIETGDLTPMVLADYFTRRRQELATPNPARTARALEDAAASTARRNEDRETRRAHENRTGTFK